MKQIIVLDAQRSISLTAGTGPIGEEHIVVTVAFWFDVSSGKEVPTNATSRYLQVTPEELLAIREGRVIEEPHRQSFADGTTALQIRQALLAAYDARATLHAEPSRINLTQFVGASYEDGTWRRAV